MEFEPIIGLEVHCQLATRSKIFCACPARPPEGKSVADVGPNRATCPVCAGHPGTLPVLNGEAVALAIRAGLALGCQIRERSVFARKNYFYPDLPKGYQISQYDRPLCEDGGLEIETKDGKKRIGIQRIHMEEDAGKNLHLADCSVVNLNRAGVPLIEIVSRPDLRSAEEAGAYLRALHAVVCCIGVTDGNMQEGNFRCDANVSVRPAGSQVFGTRAEVKNVNSFRFVEKAIEHEIARQIALVKSGGQVVQETRLYDSDKGTTHSMRSKEEAHDYRYFPEPDLLPLVVSPEEVRAIGAALPELPAAKRDRFVRELGLSPYDAGLVASNGGLSQALESGLRLLASRGVPAQEGAKPLVNLLTGEVSRLLNEEAKELAASALTAEHLAEVVLLSRDGSLSSTGAKQVISSAWKSGESVARIVEREGLKQVSDASSLEPAVDAILASNPQQAAQYRAGKQALLGFFVGQVMKATGGKANPALLQSLLKKKLG